MAITAETRTAIIELVVAATNSAPGTALLAGLVADSIDDPLTTIAVGISERDEIAMLAMDIDMRRDRARGHCIELQCLPDIDFKEVPESGYKHVNSSKKGKNRNRYWEGS